MIKSNLVRRIAARHKDLIQKDVEIAVELIVGAMISALSNDRRVEMREFGSFTVRSRRPRKGRNPRTGETVMVPAKAMIYFRATGDLKRRVKACVGKPTKVKPAKRVPRDTEPRKVTFNSDRPQHVAVAERVAASRE